MRYLFPLLALAFVGCGPQIPVRCKSYDTRYYVSIWAYESEPSLARNSHTFATFVRTDGGQMEHHTISWLPVDQFRIISSGQEGMNLDLASTLQRARNYNCKVYEFGPYEITEELYNKAMAQISLLESGQVKYYALGNGKYVCNCIHAVSNVIGPLATGATWGRAANRQIVVHYRPWLINPTTVHPEISKRLVNRL